MRWHDWVLLAGAACLVAVGPAMALQELAKWQDEDAARDLTGRIPTLDASYRAAWRLPLAGLVLLVGALGTLRAIRALVDAGVRAVSRRLVALLLIGLALLYATYYLDGLALPTLAPLVRGATLVWLYPLSALLVGGSVHRLAELEDHFGTGRGEDEVAFRI